MGLDGDISYLSMSVTLVLLRFVLDLESGVLGQTCRLSNLRSRGSSRRQNNKEYFSPRYFAECGNAHTKKDFVVLIGPSS